MSAAGQWTRQRPTTSGYYWYRENGAPAQIVEWDNDVKWAMLTGSDIPLADDLQNTIDGEFWSKPIPQPPV